MWSTRSVANWKFFFADFCIRCWRVTVHLSLWCDRLILFSIRILQLFALVTGALLDYALVGMSGDWLFLFAPVVDARVNDSLSFELINVRVEQTDDDAFLCLHCFRSIFFRSGDCRMESRYCYWIAASDHRIRYELINKNQFFVSPLQKLTQRWSFYANIRVWWSACVRR